MISGTVLIPKAPPPTLLIRVVSKGVSYAGPGVQQYILSNNSVSCSFAVSIARFLKYSE